MTTTAHDAEDGGTRSRFDIGKKGISRSKTPKFGSPSGKQKRTTIAHRSVPGWPILFCTAARARSRTPRGSGVSTTTVNDDTRGKPVSTVENDVRAGLFLSAKRLRRRRRSHRRTKTTTAAEAPPNACRPASPERGVGGKSSIGEKIWRRARASCDQGKLFVTWGTAARQRRPKIQGPSAYSLHIRPSRTCLSTEQLRCQTQGGDDSVVEKCERHERIGPSSTRGIV